MGTGQTAHLGLGLNCIGLGWQFGKWQLSIDSSFYTDILAISSLSLVTLGLGLGLSLGLGWQVYQKVTARYLQSFYIWYFRNQEAFWSHSG